MKHISFISGSQMVTVCYKVQYYWG